MLSDYLFYVEYRKGRLNAPADALSRLIHPSTEIDAYNSDPDYSPGWDFHQPVATTVSSDITSINVVRSLTTQTQESIRRHGSKHIC